MDGYRMPAPKMVLDWDHRAVGRVRTARLDPRTHEVSSIVVSLSAEAQRSMSPGTSEVEIPVRLVHSIRAREVVLESPLRALRALEEPRQDRRALSRRGSAERQHSPCLESPSAAKQAGETR